MIFTSSFIRATLIFFFTKIKKWCTQQSGSGEKSPNKDMEKKNFPTFKFVTISFCTWKSNPLGLGNCKVSNFCETGFRFFAVCSLIPRIKLSHTQQSYLCPKNQNYLLWKANLRFFLSYGLKTTIKMTIFSTFYVTDTFSSCYSQNSCNKI